MAVERVAESEEVEKERCLGMLCLCRCRPDAGTFVRALVGAELRHYSTVSGG